jgi:hypothetical protein
VCVMRTCTHSPLLVLVFLSIHKVASAMTCVRPASFLRFRDVRPIIMDTLELMTQLSVFPEIRRGGYCSLAYSALACFRMGMSGSASFQSVRKS